MKKTIWVATIAIFVLFAVGFAASDDSSTSKKQKTEVEQESETEVEQESEADRQAREEKEKKAQQEKMKKEIKDEAYEDGYSSGLTKGPVTYASDNPEDAARIYYNIGYGRPSNNEEEEMHRLYIEYFVKGYHDGYKSKGE